MSNRIACCALSLFVLGVGVATAGPLSLDEQRRLAEKHGYAIVAPPDSARPGEAGPKFSDEAARSAAAPFVRDYNLPIYPQSRVGQDELAGEAVVELARGEIEPLSLGVHALDDLKDLTVSVGPLVRAAGGQLPGERVSVRYVEAAYVRHGRARRGGPQTAVLAPLRLWPVTPLPLARGMNRQFWITVSAPKDVAAGEYRGVITIASAGRPEIRRPMVVRVRDYELAHPKDMFIGAFMRLPHDRPDREALAEFKANGIDALLWFYSPASWTIARDGQSIRQDFTRLAEFVNDAVAVGMKGPMVIGLANDYNGYYEKRLAELFDRPLRPAEDVGGKTAAVAAIDDEVVNRLYAEGIGQLSRFVRQQKDWPEIVLMPYDEATERLMPEAAHRYRQIKQVDPRMRIYGVTMSRLQWAEQVAPISDILVCNGQFDEIVALGRRLDKEVWGYGGAPAVIGAGGARFNIGLRLYRYGMTGHWFWCYNFWVDDPWNEFDGLTGDAAWVTVYPSKRAGRHVPTLAWEGIREGGDDIRYIATLREMLAAARGPQRERISAALDKFIKDIPEGRDRTVFRVDQDDFYATLPSYHRLTGMRRQIVQWIDELRLADR